MRIGHTLLFASALTLPLLSQQPAPQQQPATPPPIPTLQATARVVVLDVVVNDGNGHPVKGLTAAHFHLSEDGIPQTLASFVEHDSDPISALPVGPALLPNTFAVEPPAAGNGVMSVIVLGNVTTLDAPYVLQQIREYLSANPVTMPMAIFRLDTLGLHLVQDFTADRAALLAAVNSKRIQPARPAGARDQNFYRGAISLRQFLAKVPGRVNLIWFSTGNSGDDSFPDITRFVDEPGHNPTEILQLSRVALYTLDAGGLHASAPQPGMTNIFESGFLANNTLNDAAIADRAAQTGGRGFYNSNGFKQALAEVVNTTSHYYTLSYRPTNTNWNGEFRKIHLDVPGYSVPTGFTWAKFFGAYDENKVEYRRGYYARTNSGPFAPRNRTFNAINSAPGLVLGSNPAPNPNRRPLTPVSATRAAHQPPSPLQLAMEFSAPTPTDVHFTLAIQPSAEIIKPAKNAALPKDVYLTAPFQAAPYRTLRLHYHLDPADVHFQKIASGAYTDDLQFVAVLYRDDGILANSITFTSHLVVDAATYARLNSAPIAYDQTLAIPVSGFFFLRAAVQEIPTGHIGALQLPAEAIDLPAISH